jgi:hypothetical protein
MSFVLFTEPMDIRIHITLLNRPTMTCESLDITEYYYLVETCNHVDLTIRREREKS